ncbi:hypothetical protein BD413DRAFT_614531 [Trametes elegans]|nr:hypothetical protein BD413DRAFT_614531 [Trametes elegans]
MAHTSSPHGSPATTISSLSSAGSEDPKRLVLSYLPPDSKVLSVAPGRIYHSAFGARSDEWTYTGLRGLLVFGRNRINVYPDRPLGLGQGTSIEQNYWFRLIDAESGKGIVWCHEIPPNLDYHADKPFFHVFSGCSRMFGLRFDEDTDAEKFHRRVTSRIQITAPRQPKPRTLKSATPATRTPTSSTPPSSPPPRRVSPGMISGPAPGTFVHVAHVGVDDAGRLETSANIEPGWTMILEELQGYGVQGGEKMAGHDLDFVEGFLAGAKASLVKELQNTPPTPTTPTPLARAPTAMSARSMSSLLCRGAGAHDANADGYYAPPAASVGGKKGRFAQRKRVPYF